MNKLVNVRYFTAGDADKSETSIDLTLRLNSEINPKPHPTTSSLAVPSPASSREHLATSSNTTNTEASLMLLCTYAD